MSFLRPLLFRNFSQRFSPHRPSSFALANSLRLFSSKFRISYLVFRISLFRAGVVAVAVSQADSLAGSLAEEIQFCTPCFAASNRLDIDNIGRMKRENPFHALVIHDSPHCESLVNPPPFAGNYCAGKYLCTHFVAFPDAATDIYRIAYFEVRYFFPQTFAFNSVQHFRFGPGRSFFFLHHIIPLFPIMEFAF